MGYLLRDSDILSLLMIISADILLPIPFEEGIGHVSRINFFKRDTQVESLENYIANWKLSNNELQIDLKDWKRTTKGIWRT